MAIERIPKSKLKDFSRILEKRHRQEAGQFLIEGVHLFEEFLSSGLTVDWIVVESDFESTHPKLYYVLQKRFPKEVWTAAPSEFRRLCDTEHPQGIVASVHKPAVSPSRMDAPLMLALDQISDPGNLGTILRSADWFGISDVYLGESCVELHNPKVVRATMGSIFRLRCFEASPLKNVLLEMKQNGRRIVAASSADWATPLPWSLPGPCTLVIGNESKGITADVAGLCDDFVRIRKVGRGESLNAAVAAAVLLYEFTKGH